MWKEIQRNEMEINGGRGGGEKKEREQWGGRGGDGDEGKESRKITRGGVGVGEMGKG